MDDKERCLDKNFIKRLWRSLKNECVYPRVFKVTRLMNNLEFSNFIDIEMGMTK